MHEDASVVPSSTLDLLTPRLEPRGLSGACPSIGYRAEYLKEQPRVNPSAASTQRLSACVDERYSVRLGELDPGNRSARRGASAQIQVIGFARRSGALKTRGRGRGSTGYGEFHGDR
jgi:hypothetical protein